MRAQPRRARGTVERPYSALNLRLVLALFGLVVTAGLAVACWWLRLPVALIVVLVFCTAVSIVDLVVIGLRRRARAGGDHSLFE